MVRALRHLHGSHEFAPTGLTFDGLRARGLHAASGQDESIRARRGQKICPASPSIPNGALCEPVHRSFLHRSSTLAKFPANSLLFVENSLLGVQKFPAPLRREFR